MVKDSTLCGARFWYPSWLQRFATSKSFLMVYGFLGFTQAMSYMYFIVTLTTLEKRFKIPSHTTGIVLSGNEISQIMLSLFLSYWGGQKNRPRWIAWGAVICGLSCFILAMPHFIYGAGEEALRLTQEFIATEREQARLHNTTSPVSSTGYHKLCLSDRLPGDEEETCDQLFSYVPLVLIFLSQFILGIGNTLYYSLGQSYMDDNTKKTNTPLMLGYAFSLRMFGPLLGFFLSYVFLNMYIDPSKTPIITSNDPRWLGAWWLGWIVLGIAMIFFAVLVGLFPRDMPKRRKEGAPRGNVENGGQYEEGSEGLMQSNMNSKHDKEMEMMREDQEQEVVVVVRVKPTMKEFPTALKRLLKNKLLMFNIFAGIFYILGSGGFMTFMSKYMEVQFNKTKADSTIVAGPLNILGMVIGLLTSGWYISKKKPDASRLLFWNVFIGVLYMAGQFSYLFLACSDDNSPVPGVNGKFNLTSGCNNNCHCDSVQYNPVCDSNTGKTFYSACHAGCQSYDALSQVYSNCSCSSTERSTSPYNYYSVTFDDLTTPSPLFDEIAFDIEDSTAAYEEEEIAKRRRRRADDSLVQRIKTMIVEPGACGKGCQTAFLLFTAISSIINTLGSSGKIGNILVNYRAVAVEDKSFSQGLMLMLISLLAMIPGPILYGWIIDSTCLVWTYKCGRLGNCQMYDRRKFRLLMNSAGLTLTTIGVCFDFLVWYYGRTLDLYSEDYEENNKRFHKSHKGVKSAER